MPRNMSFMLTTPQVREGTKTVTRRQGWDHVKVGEILQAVEKCQGIPKGGHITKIRLIRVLSKRWERINKMLSGIDYGEYGKSEVVREGFPEMSPLKFVEMYCKHNKVKREHLCNRIEIEYV